MPIRIASSIELSLVTQSYIGYIMICYTDEIQNYLG